MSWYSVVYTRARAFREKRPILGWFLQQSFYVCVFLQFSLLVYASYVYVWIVCFNLLTNNIQVSLYLITWLSITIMYVWSFLRTITVATARVPQFFEVDMATDARLRSVTPFVNGRPKLDQSTREQTEEQIRILQTYCQQRCILLAEMEKLGRIRYCYECRLIKPDRSHHCSSCGFCVVRFDHHCPWINSCVAFHNYKFFLLMMIYLWMFCVFCSLTSIEAVVRYFLLDDKLEHIAWIINLGILVALGSIFIYYPLGSLLYYHWGLITQNETTCEQAKEPMFRGDPRAKYNVGRYRNLQVVFGWGLWAIPVSTPVTDGLHHEISYGSATTPCRLTVADAHSISGSMDSFTVEKNGRAHIYDQQTKHFASPALSTSRISTT